MNYLPLEFLYINFRILVVALVDVLVISFYWRPRWDNPNIGYDAAAFVKYQVILFGVGALGTILWGWLDYYAWYKIAMILLVQAMMVLCAVEDLFYGLIAGTLGLRQKAFPPPEPDRLLFVRFLIWLLPDRWYWLGKHVSRATNWVLIWFAGEKVWLYRNPAVGSKIGLLGAALVAEIICYVATLFL